MECGIIGAAGAICTDTEKDRALFFRFGLNAD